MVVHIFIQCNFPKSFYTHDGQKEKQRDNGYIPTALRYLRNLDRLTNIRCSKCILVASVFPQVPRKKVLYKNALCTEI